MSYQICDVYCAINSCMKIVCAPTCILTWTSIVCLCTYMHWQNDVCLDIHAYALTRTSIMCTRLQAFFMRLFTRVPQTYASNTCPTVVFYLVGRLITIKIIILYYYYYIIILLLLSFYIWIYYIDITYNSILLYYILSCCTRFLNHNNSISTT